MNHIIKDFLAAVGTGHNQTLAYSKEQNSIVERINKEINRHLRAFTFDTIDISSVCLLCSASSTAPYIRLPVLHLPTFYSEAG